MILTAYGLVLLLNCIRSHSRRHADAMKAPVVNFVQADLSNDEHVAAAFAGHAFDVVVCLAAETAFGKTDEQYQKVCACVVPQVSGGVVLEWHQQ